MRFFEYVIKFLVDWFLHVILSNCTIKRNTAHSGQANVCAECLPVDLGRSNFTGLKEDNINIDFRAMAYDVSERI
jgi:hypothetical protein